MYRFVHDGAMAVLILLNYVSQDYALPIIQKPVFIIIDYTRHTTIEILINKPIIIKLSDPCGIHKQLITSNNMRWQTTNSAAYHLLFYSWYMIQVKIFENSPYVVFPLSKHLAINISYTST